MVDITLFFFIIPIGLQMEVSYFVKACYVFCIDKIF